MNSSTIMHTVLYIVWFLVPTLFFILALWSKLEAVGGQTKRDNAGDMFRQGIFVLGCVLVCVLIDQTVLKNIVESTVGDSLPLGFFQAFLLPLIMLVAAKVLGPSRKILIANKTGTRGSRTPKRRR